MSSHPFHKCFARTCRHTLVFSFFALLSLFFAAQALQAAEVTLAWDANTDPVAGYRLYYGHASRSYASSVDVGNVTTYTWTGLAEGQTYYFAVTAYNASNVESAPSEELLCHTITASSGPGGSVSPSGTVFITSGATQTFTGTPAEGYEVGDVAVDGVSQGALASTTFASVTAPHTVAYTFTAKPAPVTYTITASSGSGGTISPAGAQTVSQGGSLSFSIAPNTGYEVGNVVVDGVSKGALTGYTFNNVTADHTITASFAQKTYTITAGVSGAGGTISPSGDQTVSHGGSISFSMAPASGYAVSDVVVDGVSQGALTSYTFSNVTSAHTISASFKTLNEPPVADAGPDQTVAEGALVTIMGSNSRDAEGSALSYLWEQTGGPVVQLSSTTAADPTFTAPDVGPEGAALTFRVTVTDGLGATASDTCIVNVTWVNIPPVANAGPDQTVDEWTNVTLDGSGSTDADDGIGSYAWKQVSGPAVQLNGATLAAATFVAPDVASEGASLVFELTVTDRNGLKAVDSCIVNVSWVDKPPVANPGPDQTAYEGEGVTLDGTKSSDDVGIVSHRWKQTKGTPVSLPDPSLPALEFTAPNIAASSEALTFSLTVTDTSGLQSEGACQVTVTKKPFVDLIGSWTKSSYNGQVLQGTVKVANLGNAAAGSFTVSVYLSPDGANPVSLIKTLPVDSLAAGGSKDVSLSIKARGLSGQYLIAVVDSGQAVQELDESNNRAVAAIR